MLLQVLVSMLTSAYQLIGCEYVAGRQISYSNYVMKSKQTRIKEPRPLEVINCLQELVADILTIYFHIFVVEIIYIPTSISTTILN